jgi:diguanylate cyclase (GGDEF)-like protein
MINVTYASHADAERRRSDPDLRESRRWLKQILDDLPVAAYTCDAAGLITYYNGKAVEAWGRVPKLHDPADRYCGSYRLWRPDRTPVPHDQCWMAVALREERMVYGSEIVIERPDGGFRTVLAHASPLLNAAGEMAGAVNILVDITQRKVQEQRIARLTRTYRVLSGINSAIVRIRDRAHLFKESCRLVVEDGRFEAAWIGLLDETSQEIRPVAWHSANPLPEQFWQGVRSVSPATASGWGTVGRAARGHRAVVCNDIREETNVGVMRGELVRSGLRSVIALPFTIGGQCIAVMTIYAREAGIFDAEEINLLEELAGDVSFALEFIEKERQANHLAYFDALTGLPNRQLFHDRLEREVANSARSGHQVALAILDVARFRQFNDAFGRHAGDAILKELARRLGHSIRAQDTVARIGTNQFAIMLPGIDQGDTVVMLMEQRIRNPLAEPYKLDGNELHIDIKCGIDICFGDNANADALLHHAEAALKNAKQSAETYLFYESGMSAHAAEKLRIENELHRALEQREFALHYQPKIDFASGRMCGMEALLRWQHPERGLIPPGQFIPVLEETGLIAAVGDWVIDQAATDFRAWQDRGLDPPRVAVNISALQFRDRQFVERVERAIHRRGRMVPLDLELTESYLMENIDENLVKLQAIRAAGLGVALDDFGTGYSSLNYLARLPIDALKIDRSFVLGMMNSASDRQVVAMIITLAHSLNLKVTAEGVETEAQRDLLVECRCDEVQGYLYGKPAPAEAITERLTGNAIADLDAASLIRLSASTQSDQPRH